MSEETTAAAEITIPKPIDIINRMTALQEELKYLRRLLRFAEEKHGKAPADQS